MPVADLPESMQEVIEAIGPSATLSLVHVYGGGKVYVPLAENLTESHPIARLLGHPLALKLALALGGGEPLRIPACRSLLYAERERQIIERLNAGESVGALARAYGMEERSVFRLLQRARLGGRR